MSCRSPFHVRVLATGGTLEKSYDPARGELTLDVPVVDQLLAALDQPDVVVDVDPLMRVDSLDMGEAERARIVDAVRDHLAAAPDAIVITHGTDTLGETAAALHAAFVEPACPVVLTGAMRPYRVADSDALQNVAQALMAARLLAPGVYAVFHSRVIPGDRVVKDYRQLTLIAGDD